MGAAVGCVFCRQVSAVERGITGLVWRRASRVAGWRGTGGGRGSGCRADRRSQPGRVPFFLTLSGQSGQITDEQAATVQQALAPGADGPGAYRAAYPGAGASELYERVLTDWLFAAPSQRLAQAHAQGGGRAHLYELTWSSPAMGGAFGSCHILDVPLVFGNFGAGLALLLMSDTPQPGQQPCRGGCAPPGPPSPPTATRAGPRTTTSTGSPESGTRSRPSGPIRRRSPGSSGATTSSALCRCWPDRGPQ